MAGAWAVETSVVGASAVLLGLVSAAAAWKCQANCDEYNDNFDDEDGHGRLPSLLAKANANANRGPGSRCGLAYCSRSALARGPSNSAPCTKLLRSRPRAPTILERPCQCEGLIVDGAVMIRDDTCEHAHRSA